MGKFYESVGEGLIPRVRALAWLNAVPDAPPESKSLTDKPRAVDRKTRGQLLTEKDEAPILPDAEIGAYLVEYLMDAGPVISTGMGIDRLSWTAMRDWQDSMGIALAPWELRTLRRLSAEYGAEAQRATAPDCPPPWLQPMGEVTRDAVAEKLKQSLDALSETRRQA